MMPSAQTQALYAESKQRLSDRIQSNVNAVGSIARQVVRGSKSSEVSILETLILPTSQECSDI